VEPLGVGEAVSVNERDELAPRHPDAQVPAHPAGAGAAQDPQTVGVAARVGLRDLERSVPALGIDQEDLERWLLNEEAVEQLR
jgi:hypothetical protein